MIEVLWHGRGGQGAFTASRLLGTAWVLHGGYALAFPSFGPERRGAPMRAFAKLDTRPVVDRSEITNPTFTVDLINSPPDALELAAELGLPTVNTIMLARLARELNLNAKYLEQAIEIVMPRKIWELNKNAIKAATR
jgi:pyruvate ferredoxin oxidoreductase gamma subunit